jgi:hypothetical protein
MAMKETRKSLKNYRIQKVTSYDGKGGVYERHYIQVKRFWWWEGLSDHPPLL